MSFGKWLLNNDITKLVQSQLNQRGRDRKRVVRSRPMPTQFQCLEPRNLLAGIFLDTATSDLFIFGDAENNVGSVTQVNPTTIRASINGVPSQDFSTSEFSRIVFLGFGGNDIFGNNSSSKALIQGNNGDDTLLGGSGEDEIIGGAGNDRIDGRDGDDRLVAGTGNDNVTGGTGNDRIFGTAGVNIMAGDDGNDVIFGGNEVDRINGGDGIDRIFGLGGDDILNAGNGGIPDSTEDLERDLVLGLDGDDTIIAGDGLNHLYGGNGNDVIRGGSSAAGSEDVTQNIVFGQNGNDQITGGTGFDFLAGNRGNDVINGAAGGDLIVYAGNQEAFQVTGSSAQFTVTGINGNEEGVDTVTNSEFFFFAVRDAATPVRVPVAVTPTPVPPTPVPPTPVPPTPTPTPTPVPVPVPPPPTTSLTVTVQPVIVATTNGGNRATFLGTAEQEEAIKAEVDRIYAAADVDVQWLAPVNYNNTFASRGSAATRPASDLFRIVDEGAAALPRVAVSANNLVIDMYFVDTAPGFSNGGSNAVRGLGVFDGDGVAVAVGSALPTFEQGRDVVARLLAHEIGHNLGLDHTTDRRNLMVTNGGTDSLLTNAQIAAIDRSRFTV